MRSGLMGSLLNCLKLNLRMLSHAAHGRWLGPADYEAGYDRLAKDYNENWLNRLRPVTERMLALLPDTAEHILDLGCGSGFTTAFLEKRYPEARITAADISSGMLAEARKVCTRARLVHRDMLEELAMAQEREYDLIVSAWALGYRRTESVIEACARALKKENGVLLFVVNLRDTLPAVSYAYRRTLAQFPHLTEKALHPTFPASAENLARVMRNCRFTIDFEEEASISAQPPETKRLEWLLKTGILAGFDQALPLAEHPEAAAFFESELARGSLPFDHHYAMLKGVLRC